MIELHTQGERYKALQIAHFSPRSSVDRAARGRDPRRRAVDVLRDSLAGRRIPDAEILPSQLAARVGDRYGSLGAKALASWLVRSGFAVTSENGALSPTAAARSLGASLE